LILGENAILYFPPFQRDFYLTQQAPFSFSRRKLLWPPTSPSPFTGLVGMSRVEKNKGTRKNKRVHHVKINRLKNSIER
jgi:hypothetical protein